MKREILYTMKMPYRQDFLLEGFRFGEGEKSCAVVGGIRGDEVQQMYTCARLVKALAEIEQRGNLLPGHEILVIPCANRCQPFFHECRQTLLADGWQRHQQNVSGVRFG